MKNTTNACNFYANWSQRTVVLLGSPLLSRDRQEEEVPAQPEAEPSFLTALTMPFAAFAGFGILEVARSDDQYNNVGIMHHPFLMVYTTHLW